MKKKIALGVFLFCVLLALAARFAVHARFVAEVESAEAKGYPLSPDALDAWYPAVPDETNMALALMDVFPLYVDLLDVDPDLDVFDSEFELTVPIPEEMLALKRRLADQNEEYYAAVHAAAALPGPSRYPIDLREGVQVKLEHLAKLRNVVRMLSMEALIAAEDGRGDDAARSIVAALRVSNSLLAEPLLISQLVRIACMGISTSHLEQVLNREELTLEQLAEIQASLLPLLSGDTFVRAMTGEQGTMMIALTSGDFKIGQKSWQMSIEGALDFVGYMDLERFNALKSYQTMVELAALEPLSRQDKSAVFSDEIAMSPVFGHYLIRILLPAVARSAEAFDRSDAAVLTALGTVAALRYRLDEGAYPKSPEALVPGYLDAAPIDPFEGKAMRYRSISRGVLFYSVGPNGLDDGGAPPGRPNDIRNEGDIKFEVLR